MAETEADVILQTVGISKSFSGLHALTDINFKVRAGQLVGILGPNGAGKTTLLNVITGYLRPTAGQVLFEGQRIDGKRPFEICHAGVARTFQIVQPFLEMSIIDNVATGAFFGKAQRSARNAAMETCHRVLKIVGLEYKANDLAGSLSIGEKQRLELARAMATGPRLLLLDEVMGGLTGREVDETMEVVRRINQSGTTVIMIEHLVRVILDLADEAVVLNFGKELYVGAPRQAVLEPSVIESYLGKPLKRREA
jgi:branched-chain amino acid transport system ATP-binding protein